MLNPFPRRQEYRNPSILDAAKGQPCTVNVYGVCNHDPATTVAAHSPLSDDGKGGGQKADDCFVAFACSACHDFIDDRSGNVSTPAERIEWFHRGMKKTWRRLLDMGVLK